MELLFDKSLRKPVPSWLSVYSSEHDFLLVLEGEYTCGHLVRICQIPYREAPNPQHLFLYIDESQAMVTYTKSMAKITTIKITLAQADALAKLFKTGPEYGHEYLCPTRDEYIRALFGHQQAQTAALYFSVLQAVQPSPDTTSCCCIL